MTKERNIFEILSILDRRNKPMTSAEITDELNDLGIPLTGRMIRHYFQQLDNEGFTLNLGKQGREITECGRAELKTGYVHGRFDFIVDQIVKLIGMASFDLNKQRGEVIANLSFIPEDKEDNVLKIIEEICRDTNWVSPFIKIAHAGEKLCNREVPDGMIGLATISSVTIDEILFNNGIYITSFSSCLIEFVNHKPIRCTDFIKADGVSFDPLTIFMGQGKSRVNNSLKQNHGLMPADYREISDVLRNRAIKTLEKVASVLGGLTMISRSGSNILNIHVKKGYVGVIALGGELLLAAIDEADILAHNQTVESAINFKELEPIAPVKGEVLLL